MRHAKISDHLGDVPVYTGRGGGARRRHGGRALRHPGGRRRRQRRRHRARRRRPRLAHPAGRGRRPGERDLVAQLQAGARRACATWSSTRSAWCASRCRSGRCCCARRRTWCVRSASCCRTTRAFGPPGCCASACSCTTTSAGERSLPPTRTLDLRRDPEGAPLEAGYRRCFAYSDCWVDDARLVALLAVDAAGRGGTVETRTRMTAAHRNGDRWRVSLTRSRARATRR